MLNREKGENESTKNDCEKESSWETHKDTAGRVYFVNSVTQERTRTPPHFISSSPVENYQSTTSTCYGGILADETDVS